MLRTYLDEKEQHRQSGRDVDLTPADMHAMGYVAAADYFKSRDMHDRAPNGGPAAGDGRAEKHEAVADQMELQPLPDGADDRATSGTINVSLELMQIVLSLPGKAPETFDHVRSERSLRFLSVLASHPGKWISAPRLRMFDAELDGARTDRCKAKLPEPLRRLIDTDVKLGARLNWANLA